MKLGETLLNLKWNILITCLLLFSLLAKSEDRSAIATQVQQGKVPQVNEEVHLKGPGFTSWDVSDSSGSSEQSGNFLENLAGSVVSNVISNVILKQKTKYNHMLWMQFSCQEPDVIIALPYKFKNIKWHLNNGLEYNVQDGESQTDPGGKFLIVFTSSRPLRIHETMDFEIGTQKRTVILNDGPYEVTLPLDTCRNKT